MGKFNSTRRQFLKSAAIITGGAIAAKNFKLVCKRCQRPPDASPHWRWKHGTGCAQELVHAARYGLFSSHLRYFSRSEAGNLTVCEPNLQREKASKLRNVSPTSISTKFWNARILMQSTSPLPTIGICWPPLKLPGPGNMSCWQSHLD